MAAPGPIAAPFAGTHELLGRVVDASGAPVVGMRVHVTPARRTAITADDGRFAVTGLASAWYEADPVVPRPE